MRLSETGEAAAWLKQFAPPDQRTATGLIDDLIVVTPEAFLVGMRELIRPILLSQKRPVALYPIWDIEKPTPEFFWEKPIGPAESVFPVAATDRPESPSTRFAGGARTGRKRTRKRPIDQMIPDPTLGITGSIGSIIHTISDLHKEFGSHVLDRPALHVLRANKCQQIVLVDDILASGDRAITYLEAFYKHRTIKSWCSNPGLNITIVCYAATSVALQRIMSYHKRRDFPRPHPVEVQYGQHLYRGRSFWPAEHYVEIEALCRRYAPLTSRQRLPLGYSDALAMIVFPYSVPNTAPALLWAGSAKWQPLFPNRIVPETLWTSIKTTDREYGDERLTDTLQRIGHLRLAKGDWTRHVTGEYRKLILLLALASRGFSQIARVSEILGETRITCLRLLSAARGFDLIAEDGSLTRHGLAELQYAKTVGRLPWEPPALNEQKLYFPKSLRESRGSI